MTCNGLTPLPSTGPGKLVGVPKGVNDRLMTMRLPLTPGKVRHLCQCIRPYPDQPRWDLNKFYRDLNNAVPNADKLIILGDFNARVGRDTTTLEGVIGKYGVGKCNSNGLLLLQTCAVLILRSNDFISISCENLAELVVS